MSTTTFGPTLVDGRVGREGATETWATIIAGAGNANDSAATVVVMRLQSAVGSPNWQALRRGFFSFDPVVAAPLPAGNIITAVTLSLLVNSTASNFAQSLVLCKGVLASSSAIVNGDYAGTNSERTEWSDRILTSALVGGSRTVWTLNAAGIAAVQAAYDGSTALVMAMRFSGDVDQAEPTWGSSLTDDISFASQNHGTPGSRPILTVTYRIGPGHGVVNLTGTLGNSADTVMCNLWTIEVFA